MEKSPDSLFEGISNPLDLRKIAADDLPRLCEEIRAYYIDVVSRKGGHFAAGLGVVELTVAIHYIFNTPYDELIWDVGHQAYVHKIITERRLAFEHMRTLDGISGFPKRSESKYDSFGTGHASTSVSAALGMAVASQLKGDYLKQHIAVIGDGALTGGLAFEGLNNAGVSNANLLIILNDNSISIDPAVGALSANAQANKQVLPASGIGDGRNKSRNPTLLNERGIKAVHLGYQAYFESLGLAYFGPIDGHNMAQLLLALEGQKAAKGPRVLHIQSLKGKGYAPAEKNQVQWHSPGKFDKITGEIIRGTNTVSPPKYQEVFGHTLVELARQNDKIVGITPAMPSGSSMNIFMEAFPERAFDVGIAEEHAVTFSAGLATQGLKPYCNIYSTFLQRAIDQVIHDVCLQKLPVVFCLDRAGLVGEDGPTHHGAFDIALLRAIPDLVIAAPKDEIELRNLMFSAQFSVLPFVIRYPRGKGLHLNWQQAFQKMEIGKAEVIQEGEKVAILCLGNTNQWALDAVQSLDESIKPGVYNMRFVKPLDAEMIHHIDANYQHIITLEDGCLSGGFGSAILEFLNENQLSIPVSRLGIPDHFIPHGNPQELREVCGLDAQSIANTIKQVWT